jgi:hypothetical protein
MVMDFARSHKAYAVPDQEPLHDQPKFDDITRYGPDDDKEEKLWQLEAARLVQIVDNVDMPLVLENPVDTPTTAREGFELLSSITDELICILFLCNFDNQMVLLEHFRGLANLKPYIRCRMVVQRRLVDRYDGDSPKDHWPKSNLKLYFALVDFLTEALARFSVQASRTDYWYVRSLGSTTRLSTKMTYLASDPHELAEMSLHLADDAIAKEEAHECMGLGGLTLIAGFPGPKGKRKCHRPRDRNSGVSSAAR